MSGKPALSVLIPWYERDELRLTLAANAPAFRAHEVEVLVLNCGGSSTRLRELITASEAPGVRQLDIAAPRFNKSLALNIGLSYSRSDIVFTLDADVVLLGDVLGEARTLADGQSFVTLDWRYESEPAPFNSPQPEIVNKFVVALVTSSTLEFLFRDGTTVQYQLSRQDIFGIKRANPGLLLAKKRDLLEIQGHNSELESWGWEDNDVLVRLQYALGLRRVQKGSALHLTHGDDRRRLQGSRIQSDRLNFLRCCRNYNNGLFLGTYHADVAWAEGNVTEMVPDVVTPDLSELAVRCSQDHNPSYMSGPVYCGNEDDAVKPKSPPDGSKRPASIGQLLIDATLKKYPLPSYNVLHIENYHGVVCNKYSQDFRGYLPLNAYDIIVDNNIASYACCQFHLKALMENYSKLLAPSGWLLTIQQGMDWSATDSCWKLSEADLACLAGQFGFAVTKTGYGVYTLTRMDQAQI
jgi:glycosyltransferase involved in cell wall biosynthesis